MFVLQNENLYNLQTENPKEILQVDLRNTQVDKAVIYIRFRMKIQPRESLQTERGLLLKIPIM